MIIETNVVCNGKMRKVQQREKTNNMKQHYTTTWNVSERLPPPRVATAEHRITATYRHVRWKHVVCPKNILLVWIFKLNILVNVSKTAIHCNLNFGRILRNMLCAILLRHVKYLMWILYILQCLLSLLVFRTLTFHRLVLAALYKRFWIWISKERGELFFIMNDKHHKTGPHHS